MKHKIIGLYRFTIPPDTPRKLTGNSHQTAAAPSLCRRLSPPDTLVPGVQHLMTIAHGILLEKSGRN